MRWLPIVGLRLGRRLIGLRQWPVKWAVDRRIIGPERSIRHDAAIGERHETASAIWNHGSLAEWNTEDRATIARERIVREAEEKTGFLDLGRLGLTELPEELFQLKHLRGLNLGAGGASELEDNFVEGSLHRLAELGELRRLSLSGTDLSDFAPLQVY